VAALQLLAVVRKMDQRVSDVCDRFEPLPQVLKNVRYNGGKPLETKAVQAAIEEGEGRLAGAGRLVIRPSGTEPVIRVMAEGEDSRLVEAVVSDIVSALEGSA
jgi:phosphoglucosamine mutase